jgi:hypothetical protein
MSEIIILMVILELILACLLRIHEWVIRRDFESMRADGDARSL